MLDHHVFASVFKTPTSWLSPGPLGQTGDGREVEYQQVFLYGDENGVLKSCLQEGYRAGALSLGHKAWLVLGVTSAC